LECGSSASALLFGSFAPGFWVRGTRPYFAHHRHPNRIHPGQQDTCATRQPAAPLTPALNPTTADLKLKVCASQRRYRVVATFSPAATSRPSLPPCDASAATLPQRRQMSNPGRRYLAGTYIAPLAMGATKGKSRSAERPLHRTSPRVRVTTSPIALVRTLTKRLLWQK